MCASALKRVVCVGAVSRLHFSGVHSHVHVVNAQLAMEVFVNIAAKPHSLRGEEERQQEPFFFSTPPQATPYDAAREARCLPRPA